MATECFPTITRCFSSKTMKANKRSDSSLRFSGSSFRTSGSTSSRSSCTVASKRPWEEEMREVFRHLDTDSDGKISASELREYFASVEENMTEEEAQGMIDELDSDGDGLLGFGDFLGVMGKGKGDQDHGLLLKEVFGMFEQEKGSGRITPRGLQRMLGRLGDSKSYEECAAMIQIYDVDGDGHLDFQEFYQMMS